MTSRTAAQVTELVSIDSNGVQENYDASLPPLGRFISADGRFLAFVSDASNLVPGDANGTWDIFVRDRLNRTTERVSVDSSGAEGNGISGLFGLSISDDGRFVAFESLADNLVAGDVNGARDVFVHDRWTGATECAAVNSSGTLGDGASFYPSLSSDGRFVAFTSEATNLVAGDTNASWDTFVRDRASGTTERVSVNFSGVQGNGDSYKPEISADGRFVVFESIASNLVGGDTNSSEDVFVRDRLNGLTRRASVASTGAQGSGHSYLGTISDDGRSVAFWSSAANLVPGDVNLTQDVFVHDFLLGTTELASIASDGTQSTAASLPRAISADGRFVLFQSNGPNLVPGDTNLASDLFLRDRVRGTTQRVSVAGNGAQGSGGSALGALSRDGRYVMFCSNAPDLVQGDSNGFFDIFIHDREARGFTSLCEPGLNGVIPCPCGNAPSTSARGCDNSAFTGGARLSAGGVAYLSIDSLVFTTSDERPTAMSILLQGNTLVPTGLVFGQGVRCVGGTLKRMYAKTANAGSITAPDLGAGDSMVSVRSAVLGDPILPGESRYYLVYYRDPTVLGGCPAISTFNATQSGRVTWWP